MKKDKVIKTLITIFFVLLPFLDMLRTTTFKDIEIFDIALIELINITLIGVSLILTLTKVSFKKIIGLILYLLLVGIYIFLHYKNIIKFDTSLFLRANYSFITETFYILRVYILPLMLLYVLFNNRDIFNKKYFFKIIKYLIVIISGSIIVLNILKLSYISYSAGKGHILYNMFDYFLYQGDFKQLSSRGFFDSANELSAILFMLLPLNIFMLYKEEKKSNVILFVMQFLSMILLGTRTAAYGSVIISITAGVCYLFLIIIKKINYQKFFTISFGITTLCLTAYMSISPFMLGRISDGTPDFSIKNQTAYDDIEKTDIKNLNKLIKKYQSEYMISDTLLKLYPIKNDPEFWLSVIKRDKSLNNDSRKMKLDILNRIYELNNNKTDKWLGMGYTLNFMDAERDYFYQFYLFGIIGIVLFIFPYFGFLLYYIFISLKNYKQSLNLKRVLAFMSVILGLVIAYYSGHVFGWVSPMMILVLCVNFLSIVVNLKGVEKNVQKK